MDYKFIIWVLLGIAFVLGIKYILMSIALLLPALAVYMGVILYSSPEANLIVNPVVIGITVGLQFVWFYFLGRHFLPQQGGKMNNVFDEAGGIVRISCLHNIIFYGFILILIGTPIVGILYLIFAT